MRLLAYEKAARDGGGLVGYTEGKDKQCENLQQMNLIVRKLGPMELNEQVEEVSDGGLMELKVDRTEYSVFKV